MKNELNELIIDCLGYKDVSEDYIPEVYKKFEDAFEKAMKVRESTVLSDVNTAKKNLEDAKKELELNLITNVLENLEKQVEDMKKADHVLNAPQILVALNMSCVNSTDRLNKITNIKSAVKNDLESLIILARAEIGTASEEKLVELLNITSKAQTALDSEVLDNMVKAYVDLNSLL